MPGRRSCPWGRVLVHFRRLCKSRSDLFLGQEQKRIENLEKSHPVGMRLVLATVNNAGTSFVLNQLRSGFNFAIGVQREYGYRSASILGREQEFPGRMHRYVSAAAVADGSRVYKLEGTVFLYSVGRYARTLIVLSDRIQGSSFGMQS